LSEPALYSSDVEFYDIAFGWDISEEVEWLLARLGPGCRKVLEPACGSGRVLEELAQRGLSVVGLDRSSAMVDYAKARLATAGVEGEVLLADMVSFELDESFDGAVCPINTLAHLEPGELARHLDCMARHLVPGARYLAQVAIRDAATPEAALGASTWDANRDETRLRVTWAVEKIDVTRARERHRSRIEVVEGPRRGQVLEEDHVLTTWTPTTWRTAIRGHGFAPVATYDGEQRRRPRVELGPGRLLWHELVRT
jgi:SAM-dependent methyltransferase